ncbi:sensor histidine kinase [Streptococcus caviae]|uniref:sensor histidine kinase n=1 Tax=Streptococcus sp. 'caviae' TaxID=1915004 RepID=UPI0015D66611|nr:sensor histidine kinase [Streptococcus sp. 'caviae']
MKVDFKSLFKIADQSVTVSIIKPTIMTLSLYSFIQWLSYNLSYLGLTSEESAMDIRKYLSLVFMISVPVFIASLNQKMTSHLELVLLKQKEKELRYLTNYSHEIEHLYRDIRSFRHDYANVLASLRYGIEHNDMASVRQTFEEVAAGSAGFLQSDHFEIGNLSLIRDDAIKSIFSAKLSQAAEYGIQVKVEIPEEIGRPNLTLLDFIRLLSILLDNAIEGAAESNDRKLQVSYFKHQEQTVLIIANSMLHQDISLTDLYERGKSSKGLDRGWGLANVREILNDYPHMNLKTSIKHGRFQQTLEIG